MICNSNTSEQGNLLHCPGSEEDTSFINVNISVITVPLTYVTGNLLLQTHYVPTQGQSIPSLLVQLAVTTHGQERPSIGSYHDMLNKDGRHKCTNSNCWSEDVRTKQRNHHHLGDKKKKISNIQQYQVKKFSVKPTFQCINKASKPCSSPQANMFLNHLQ